jgi:hypothetical protein
MTVCPGLYHNNRKDSLVSITIIEKIYDRMPWRDFPRYNTHTYTNAYCLSEGTFPDRNNNKYIHKGQLSKSLTLGISSIIVMSLFQRFLDWILEKFQQCGILYSSFYILTWSWILCVRINHDGMFYTITKIQRENVQIIDKQG